MSWRDKVPLWIGIPALLACLAVFFSVSLSTWFAFDLLRDGVLPFWPTFFQQLVFWTAILLAVELIGGIVWGVRWLTRTRRTEA